MATKTRRYLRRFEDLTAREHKHLEKVLTNLAEQDEANNNFVRSEASVRHHIEKECGRIMFSRGDFQYLYQYVYEHHMVAQRLQRKERPLREFKEDLEEAINMQPYRHKTGQFAIAANGYRKGAEWGRNYVLHRIPTWLIREILPKLKKSDAQDLRETLEAIGIEL